MEQAYYYRHSPLGGHHSRLAEHEAAASRVTYLTGMWRPVNRPCKAGLNFWCRHQWRPQV